jgi:hypothetical protein
MLKDLIKLANHLDQKGLRKEADSLDDIIRKMATFNSGETKAGVEVKIEDWEAPDWGNEAAVKLIEALREEAPDLDLIQLMESCFDEEAWYRYEDEVYHTIFWTDDLLKSFNKGFDYTWELTGKVDYAKGRFVSFALTPKNPWEVGERIIKVFYKPGKLKIKPYEI